MSRHHVAISFASENSWIAQDIYEFLKEVGYTTYYSKESPDKARGHFGMRLTEIYDESLVNVIIHSDAYRSQPKDSTVQLERTMLYERHVRQGDEDSLFILKVDGAEVVREFSHLTSHPIDTCGIYGARKMILGRLQEAFADKYRVTARTSGRSIHPESQNPNRGPVRPCEFTIPNHYTTDKLGRWKRLGDILVTIQAGGYPYDSSLYVYLIPSGRVPPYLSNSKLIGLDPKHLEQKRDLSREFIKRHKNQVLSGEMFFIESDGMQLPHVYSKQYDDLLNEEG
jgi:hypothetical protein